MLPKTFPPTGQEHLSENELVSLHLGGDFKAFQTLYQRYVPRLFNFSFRIIRSPEDAEDIVQETFIRVAKHVANFDQNKKFSTWIYTITSNLCKNYLRDNARRLTTSYERIIEEEHRVFPSDADDPLNLSIIYDILEKVEEAIAELPPHQRDAILARDVEGYMYHEMAVNLKTNIGTVKSRLSRARAGTATRLRETGITGAR